MKSKQLSVFGLLAFTLCMILISSASYGQIPNHSYPRTLCFHFGSACYDFYARHDMVIKSSRSTGWVEGVKAINPDCIILSTSGWTSWGANDDWFPPGTEDHYLALDSNGDAVSLGGGKLTDITEYNPPYQGKRFNQALPDYLMEITPMDTYDGIATDWFWVQPWGVNNVDFDRNGVNDFSEHGNAWVNTTFSEGTEALLLNLRNALPEDKVILCNSGTWHRYGQATTNGVSFEHLSYFSNFKWHWDMYQFVNANYRQPTMHALLCQNHADDPDVPDRAKDYFRNMRFLLAFTLLGDGYYYYMDSYATEYYYNYWYDEFDVPLGYPKGDAQQLANGCIVRVFDRGLSIINPTGADVTVTANDISSVEGYGGPYYRFYGGQDPEFNDGSLFDQVVLFGDNTWNSKTRGDGIVLTVQPDTVVSDIIIDNINPATSPGSERSIFSGSWTRSNDYSQAYYVSVRSNLSHYAHNYAVSGDGSAEATFTPTISRAGQYEIFEWHGEVPGESHATNVPHVITHRDGETTVLVDQTQNQGQWNSIGIYTLDDGNQVIINNDANGTVISDALKFVLQHVKPDLEAPDPPTGVEVIQL